MIIIKPILLTIQVAIFYSLLLFDLQHITSWRTTYSQCYWFHTCRPFSNILCEAKPLIFGNNIWSKRFTVIYQLHLPNEFVSGQKKIYAVLKVLFLTVSFFLCVCVNEIRIVSLKAWEMLKCTCFHRLQSQKRKIHFYICNTLMDLPFIGDVLFTIRFSFSNEVKLTHYNKRPHCTQSVS